jgi:hypothetical protein
MVNKISEQIEDAQACMHKEIMQSLAAFTEKTGLTVRYVNWSIATVQNAEGHTYNATYYDVRSCIATSMS